MACKRAVLFLSACPERKSTKKKEARASSPVLLRHCQTQTGRKLASLKQTPLTAPDSAYAYAPVTMPGRLRSEKEKECDRVVMR